MIFTRRLLTACLASLLFCCSLNAQQPSPTASFAGVPRLVNFSGRAADAQGKAISGVAGATFAIYQGQYEGTPLWLETQNVQADAKGNYSVQLGATRPDGLPLDLFSSGEARWLGVTINGGQEQPRVLLLSVPYALKAADAETVGGLPPSAFVLANKSQADAASHTTLSSAPTKSNTAPPPLNPVVTGSGVVDFIPMWDTTSDIVDSMIFQKSSQVGIGTTAPATRFDVFSTSNVNGPIGQFGSKGVNDSNSVKIYNGSGFAETFEAGCFFCFVPGALVGDGGLRVAPGKKIVFGDQNASRLVLDSLGDAEQPRGAGGMVKAMALVSPNGVVFCFNSAITGAQATHAPCGFGFHAWGPGDYTIDFGFQVWDRFVSTTAGGGGGHPRGGDTTSACVLNLGAYCNNTITANQVEVTDFCSHYYTVCPGYVDNYIYVLVY